MDRDRTVDRATALTGRLLAAALVAVGLVLAVGDLLAGKDDSGDSRLTVVPFGLLLVAVGVVVWRRARPRV